MQIHTDICRRCGYPMEYGHCANCGYGFPLGIEDEEENEEYEKRKKTVHQIAP